MPTKLVAVKVKVVIKNTMLHESVGIGLANAVYEAPFLPAVNFMMMLQMVSIVNHLQKKVLARLMWDTGANLAMVTEDMCKWLKLSATGQSAQVSLADGKVKTCQLNCFWLTGMKTSIWWRPQWFPQLELPMV